MPAEQRNMPQWSDLQLPLLVAPIGIGAG